jgi:hypothetical protein
MGPLFDHIPGEYEIPTAAANSRPIDINASLIQALSAL